MGQDPKKSGKVKVKGGGLEGAVDLLNELNPQEKEKLLKQMERLDPKVTHVIKENLVTIEDLKHLSTSMFASLLKEVSIKDLALAFRQVSKDVIEAVMVNLSKNNQRELLDIVLGPPQKKSLVDDATRKVLEVFRKKVEKGEIVFKRHGDDPYV